MSLQLSVSGGPEAEITVDQHRVQADQTVNMPYERYPTAAALLWCALTLTSFTEYWETPVKRWNRLQYIFHSLYLPHGYCFFVFSVPNNEGGLSTSVLPLAAEKKMLLH